MENFKFSKIGCLISLAGGLSSFFIGFIVLFVPIFLVLGLFESDGSSNDGGSSIGGSGSIAGGGSGFIGGIGDNGGYGQNFNSAPCNFEDTTVIVLNGSGKDVLATVSLEDYVIGTGCLEIGACGGNSNPDSGNYKQEHYIKTFYIAAKTFVLTKGGYDSTTKTVKIKASTRDQLWCDLENGCFRTHDSEFTNAYPANYPKDKIINENIEAETHHFTEEDLETFHEYYQDIYGELYLPKTVTGEITKLGWNEIIAYKSSTQLFWREKAIEGKNYREILELTATGGVADSYRYKDKYVYELKKYCDITKNDYTDYTEFEYVNWMIDFANDDTHGYSMENRNMDPDVDCSSFVYYALINNGYTKEQLGSSAFVTSTMENILTSAGFKKINYEKDKLQIGDILWYPAGFNDHKYGHTEVYVGNGKTVGAHTDRDRKTGDSSGTEVNVANIWTDYKAVFRMIKN